MHDLPTIKIPHWWYMGISDLSAHCYCEPKNVLKKIVYNLKKKLNQIGLFVIIDEATLTYHHHTQSGVYNRIHS